MNTAFDLELEQAVLGAFLIDHSTSWSASATSSARNPSTSAATKRSPPP
ncbi:MAG: hypothetical protein ACJ79V_09520 [Myxococcales bacterium]